MDNKNILLSLICFFLYGCGPSEVPVDQLNNKNGLKVVKESGEPFTGRALKLKPDGSSPERMVEYKNGKLDGVIQFWHSNGELKEEFFGRFNNEFYLLLQAVGDTAGKANKIEEDALDSFLTRYGEHHSWYDNGEMESEGEYSEDGSQKVGSWRRWYKNGELAEEGEYSRTVAEAEEKRRRRRRLTGTKIGKWQKWYEDGQVYVEENYTENGLQDGIWQTYCVNGTLGKKMEFKAGVKTGIKQYWACDGKELNKTGYLDGEQHGTFVIYQAKKSVRKALGYGSLINNVDRAGLNEYNVNSADYFKSEQGDFEQGKKTGLWTAWDEAGKVTGIKDFNQANFINPEYQQTFLKKAKMGPYATHGYANWEVGRYKFKDVNSDVEATQLYLSRKLVNPSKKIAVFDRWGRDSDIAKGVSKWTYPIIVTPEILFEEIKAYPGVKLDSVDTDGHNRLHLCTLLMLGKKINRCSETHFLDLLKQIPVNAKDYKGRTAVNLIAESYHTKKSSRSRRRSDTQALAISAIKALAQAGADINHQNAKGKTALMSALSRKEYALAEALLELGVETNLKDVEGRSAIFYTFFVFKRGYSEETYNFKLDDKRKNILTLMVQKGVKIDSPNANGDAIKDLALKKGAINTAMFLEGLSSIKADLNTSQKGEVLATTVEHEGETIIDEVVQNIEKTQVEVQDSLSTPVDISKDQIVASTLEQTIGTESAAIKKDQRLDQAKSIDIIQQIESSEIDHQNQLYQDALLKIKKNRLSKPKGDSALDKLNQLAQVTSESDARVIELRKKIADKYLSLARGRLNDYRFQDALRFIKTSQKILPSKTAVHLKAEVEMQIAEERAYAQQQQLQQQNNESTSQPNNTTGNKSGLGDLFKSIFE